MTRGVSRKTIISLLCMMPIAGAWSGISFAQPQASPTKSAAVATKRTTAPAKAAAAPVDITALKSVGMKGAPITMEVFSDFQCPACRELYFQTVRPVIDNYVSAGKVYLVHRDMPLPMHQHSRQAARYANAAARLRKMERVVAALFDRQAVWTADGSVDATVAAVLTPAEMKQVRKLVNSGTLDGGIDKDVALGTQFRVVQTPTTVITYKGQTYPVVGVVSYSMMKTFLEQLLRQ